jgi:glutamine synthetase
MRFDTLTKMADNMMKYKYVAKNVARRHGKTKVKSTPGALDEVLDALEKDHDFLLKGGVFTKDVIETWLDYKRKKELDAVRLRPHPYEFALYFDI